MAYDELLADDIRQALSSTTCTERKMFGGIAFLINGNMCITVNNRPDHIMMVRIDPKNEEALERKGASIAIMKGKKCRAGYFLRKNQ